MYVCTRQGEYQPGDVIVDLPLVAFGELVAGRGTHRRDGRVVADVVTSLRRTDPTTDHQAEENNNLVWNNLLTRMRQQMYYAQDYAHNVLQPPNMFIATSQKCISV